MLVHVSYGWSPDIITLFFVAVVTVSEGQRAIERATVVRILKMRARIQLLNDADPYAYSS